MQAPRIRLAKHAGSWYTAQKDKLNEELETYLLKADIKLQGITKLKAIIGPHAGFTYSGPTAAWVYKYLKACNQQKPYSRVFLLGPSHKKYFKGCSISGMSELETPLGNLTVDQEVVQALKNTANFITLSKKDEENEHSLEMHLPYLSKVFSQQVKIVPIIVGNIDAKAGQDYGKILAPYYNKQDSIFVISSDFCHWGSHFDYQPHDNHTPIWRHIESLDRQGMELIEHNDIAGFDAYIDKTGNTICGSNPIRVLMNTIRFSAGKSSTQFVKYDQSSQVTEQSDSSVSYASSVTFVT